MPSLPLLLCCSVHAWLSLGTNVCAVSENLLVNLADYLELIACIVYAAAEASESTVKGALV